MVHNFYSMNRMHKTGSTKNNKTLYTADDE